MFAIDFLSILVHSNCHIPNDFNIAKMSQYSEIDCSKIPKSLAKKSRMIVL